MSKSSHTEGEKLQVLTPSSPSASTIAPPRLLREISISADNIPTLCLDDYPIAATPLMQQDFPHQKFFLAEKRGLAILVNCNYEGIAQMSALPSTNMDANEMKMTFEQFDYDIHQLKNGAATQQAVVSLLDEASHYLSQYSGGVVNKDGGKKVIIFAFSGHGADHDRIATNDGKWLYLKDEVRLPLVKHREVSEIPKLFLIDANRGSRRLVDRRNQLETNYRIDCSTISDHTCHATAHGSVWMPVLARVLRERDDTLPNVVDTANQIVTRRDRRQQPEALSRLSGHLKLYYTSRKVAVQISTQGARDKGQHSAERVFCLAEKRGLAILVTCDYKDTATPSLPPLPSSNVDADEMKLTFEQFDYDIHQLKNAAATEQAVVSLLDEASHYLSQYRGGVVNKDGGKKVIIFAFSGHGTDNDQIMTNDGKLLNLPEQVRLPLVKHREVSEIPKLFFMDFSRGSDTFNDKNRQLKTNYRIDYSTISDHVSYATTHGSVWMPVLARELRERDDTFSNIVDTVNQNVYGREKRQQPDSLSRLSGRLKLYYTSKNESGPKAILQAALKEGSIPHKDDKFLIHGPGGVGKSSLIDLFLDEVRDNNVRISTPVATAPLHLIREVSTSTFTADWRRVNYERLSRMVAHTSKQLYLERNKGEEEKERGGDIEEAAIAVDSNTDSQNTPDKPLQEEPQNAEVMQDEPQHNKPEPSVIELDDSQLLEPEVDDEFRSVFSDFLADLHDKIRNSDDAGEMLMSHSIRLTDSGGQPQFHDLLSIFLSHISGFISVFKLSESLSDHGEVAFFDAAGVLTNEPYESHYSHEQVIRHDLLAIQSEAACNGIEEMPNLAFVGTFRDQKDNCPETPQKKDEILHSIITEMLPPEMQECVITNGSTLKQATFQVNARTPEAEDFERVEKLKVALMCQSRVKSRDLPLKWHGYEIALRMLMQELGRQSLSRKECEFIGRKLDIDPAALDAALDYLRELNIISFYDVLPDVIFGTSQVILDKITELVCYSLKLQKGDCAAVVGAERKFLRQGIISLEFLKSPALSKHYTPGLFEQKDLIEVLVSLLVVSDVGYSEAGVKQYIMPCVLNVSSVYPYRPFPGNQPSSFILHFSKKSPMFGVYCCTIASLMSNYDWKPLTQDGEIVQVARNSIEFEMPMEYGGKVIFNDPLFSYLEVVVELPSVIAGDEECRIQLYPYIRDTFLAAIEQAMENLKYEVVLPKISFLCPKPSAQCSLQPHPAIVHPSRKFWKCSLKSSVCDHLKDEHRIWLPAPARTPNPSSSATGTAVASCMDPVTGLDEEVSDRHLAIIASDHVTDWEALCPYLELSRQQKKEIRNSFAGDNGKQKHECLEVWKETKGKKATYSAFINAAKEAQAQKLADNVEDMLKKQQTASPPHSEELDVEVSDKDLATIARDHLTDWEALRPFLELSRSKAKEILKSFSNNYGKQKLECLEEWKEMKGHEATYYALINAAEDARLQSLADNVKKMLKK